jgi:hypothetical protein
MAIDKQIIAGDIKTQHKMIDATTRDLLRSIFVVEPNLRTTFAAIRDHKFFQTTDPAFWPTVLAKKLGPVPFIPDDSYSHLLRPSEQQSVQNPEEDNSVTPTKTNFYGNRLSVTRINKEFENF